MGTELDRLLESKSQKKNWKKWGPYISEREWGTVREDYSPNGDAWNYLSHEQALSKAYRWGEDGIGGICDEKQLLCFGFAFWNGKDSYLKERFFGLSNPQGNHGEDIKEYHYYLDNVPTHSYMKMLYKYPQTEFPYNLLLNENLNRGRDKSEYELIDTGIFNEDKYFDIFIEYAKADEEDILIKATIFNRFKDDADLQVIPQMWFRNTWSWGIDDYKPAIRNSTRNFLNIEHREMDGLRLYYEGNPNILFCENETNFEKLYGVSNNSNYCKDGINNYLIDKKENAVNSKAGTKSGLIYNLNIKAGESKVVKLRLNNNTSSDQFKDFETVFEENTIGANDFYASIQNNIAVKELKNIQRQAFAGMLWNKQFYYYDIPEWLDGDPSQPTPPPERKHGRNSDWVHLE